jgi:hypothetical protein
MGSRERNQSDLTLRNLKPLFDERREYLVQLLDRIWVVTSLCQCDTVKMYLLFNIYMICILFVLRPCFFVVIGCHQPSISDSLVLTYNVLFFEDSNLVKIFS